MQSINRVSDEFSTCGQISVAELPEIAASGFRSVICNRPDNESPDQPSYVDIETAARHHGLQVAYLPVVLGSIGPADVSAFANLIKTLPAPVLGFCRSGKRADALYAASQR